MNVERRKRTLEANGLEFSALEAGASDNPVVICLHGFPDAPETFEPQIDPLVEAGYRVIVPTLRGYEPSSQPANGDYSLDALADDVVGWLDNLGVQNAHLVGHDWGAVVTYVAAARDPDRFRTVTALAIPPVARIPEAVRRVPKQLVLSWYMTFFQLRGVSEAALTRSDWWLLRRLWQRWSPGYTIAEAHRTALRNQFEQPGVLKGSLAYYRQNATPPIMLGMRRPAAMQLRKVAVPTLIVHGAADGCMDRRMFNHSIQSSDFPAGVERVEVPGAGHFLHLERPAAVNTAVLNHLGATR